MKQLKDIMSMLKWHPNFDPSKARLTYRDRFSNACSEINCANVIATNRKGIRLRTSDGEIYLPAHRVVKVVYGRTDILYQRN